MISSFFPILEKHQEKVLFREQGREDLSFAEFSEKLRGRAAQLSEEVIPGEPVGVLSSATRDFFLTICALIEVGASPYPLNLREDLQEWTGRLDAVSAKKVYVDEALQERLVEDSFSEFELRSLGGKKRPELPASPADRRCSGELLLSSSGSGGSPTIAALSLDNLFAAAASSNQQTGFSAGGSWLLSLPSYHIGGMQIFFRALHSGASLILNKDYSPESIMRHLRLYPPCFLSLVPTVLERILAQKGGATLLASQSCILLGGASISSELEELCRKEDLPVCMSFGMTETSSHISLRPISDAQYSTGSLGRPFVHCEVRDLQDSFRSLPLPAEGRLFIRSEQIADRIFENASWHNTDGHLLSNDLVFINEDGELFHRGRVDRVFISGGENIHLDAVEDRLRAYPSICELAVFPFEDRVYGSRPVAFVVLSADGNEEDYLRWQQEAVPGLFRPRETVFCESLPRLETGKIDRKALEGVHAEAFQANI